jgi:hypothetical protein
MQHQRFFRFKNKDRYKYPKKLFLNFFLRFLGVFVPVPCEKVVLIGFSTGTKSEKLNFYSSIILNSLLVPVLYPKSNTFSHLAPKKSKKKFQKSFFWVFVPVQIPYFWTQKIFEKIWCCIWYLILPSKIF